MLICRVNKKFAMGDYCDDGFIVFKGSCISDHTTRSFDANNYSALRNNLIAERIIVNDVFVSDYVFSSLSAAACVVEGRMISGPEAWKENLQEA